MIFINLVNKSYKKEKFAYLTTQNWQGFIEHGISGIVSMVVIVGAVM